MRPFEALLALTRSTFISLGPDTVMRHFGENAVVASLSSPKKAAYPLSEEDSRSIKELMVLDPGIKSVV